MATNSVLTLVQILAIVSAILGELVIEKEYTEGFYTGDVNEKGQRHGQGVLRWKNGDKHAGRFQDNLPNGPGTYFFKNGVIGDRFIGEYTNGRRSNGNGTLLFSNGNSFEGRFENGVPNGHGVYQWNDGSQHDGDRYEGEHKDGMRHGVGIYYWANGKRYEGEFANGKREGFGIMYTENGDNYDGQWKKGQPFGEGKLTVGSMTVEVNWVNGKPVPKPKAV
ncbi:hypothetical protein TCAL_09063 [Tigriopus californicus]|uniref:Uncharacterized protein n=1 Tax=Tigriopus californicus TaxID=6832 RepID=A0A553P3A4_TIGCA|nr:radial spoke head 1 homolog isoform X1 [Tigriopus californicus]TRY72177.1 hypothetical protein TCAL_09063 [Tigriopus californicus]|eukprot:TCALIF_09063-PA protein Name:"Similar to RSPH1 Radial spoke head 1 homolog (Homo sapiens)" AED:0.23 eAED:0.23 QI:27/0.5/0.66/1/1/1/3/223/220